MVARTMIYQVHNLQRLILELLGWPWLAIGLIAAGLTLTGVPEHFEGPTLITLNKLAGHGITTANLVAGVVLLCGIGSLVLGALNRPELINAAYRRNPLTVACLLLQLCGGIALILKSGISTALVWWGPGVAVCVLALLGLAYLVSVNQTPS